MDGQKKLLPHIALIGDPEENFYHLGIKDRSPLIDLKSQAKNYTGFKKGPIAEILKSYWQNDSAGKILENLETYEYLKAYSKGINLDLSSLLFFMILPEIISPSPLFKFHSPGPLWDLSSFYGWDSKSKTPFICNIMDMPLIGILDKEERSLFQNFDNSPSQFSFGFSGFPLPFSSAMNSRGIIITAHKIINDDFNVEGLPIFEIIYQIQKNVDSIESFKSYINSISFMSAWKVHMVFPEGKTIEARVEGERVVFKETDLTIETLIMSNNEISELNNSSSFYPYSLNNYSKNKFNQGQKLIEIIKNTKASISEKSLLKTLLTPAKKKVPGHETFMPIHNPFSIAAFSLNAVKGEAIYINGKAPKFLENGAIHIKKIWKEMKGGTPDQLNLTKRKIKLNFQEFYTHFSLAQSYLDRNDIHRAYHHIQLSISYQGDSIERTISEFFFYVLEFVFDKHAKTRARLLEELKRLKNNLPPYLGDQCLLFIFRLEKIISGKINVTEAHFTNDFYRDIFYYEQKIPSILLHTVVSKSINIRLDLLDIYYGHIGLLTWATRSASLL